MSKRTKEDLDDLINDLEDAMGFLYQARYKVTGPEGSVDGKYYPEMDRETFDEIVHLQDAVQRLTTRLKKEKINVLSREGKG